VIVTTPLGHTHADSGVPRSSQQRKFHRECAPGRRNALRGARRDHRHAREATSEEAVRCILCFINYPGENPSELISLLSRARRLQLRDFSDKVIDTKAAGHCVPPQYASGAGGARAGAVGGSNALMEVDSNASTPA
jgi:hypothetical protein